MEQLSTLYHFTSWLSNAHNQCYQISETYCEGRKGLQLLRKRLSQSCVLLLENNLSPPFLRNSGRCERAKHAR